MTRPVQTVLDFLKNRDFETRLGTVAPFGEQLPLVGGVAWDPTTALIAFVVDSSETYDEDAWVQLLFAASALRHHVSGDRPAAFGAPLIVAIVDEAAGNSLRVCVERLSDKYAVFNRVDLTLVPRASLTSESELTFRLAPLLPACRDAIHQGLAIDRPDIDRFWSEVELEITAEAALLPQQYALYRNSAAREVFSELRPGQASERDLPAPAPIEHVELDHFRSFENATIEFGGVTVIHGANGTGKSSIIEAVELLSTGTTGRRPRDQQRSARYAEHLPTGGHGQFTLTARFVDHPDTTVECGSVADQPHAELARAVLTQEAFDELVAASPAARYRRFLEVTGLELPDLGGLVDEIARGAKSRADSALQDAGLPPLRAVNSNATEHLQRELAVDLSADIPPTSELEMAEAILSSASLHTYEPAPWDDEDRLLSVVRAVENVAQDARQDLAQAPDLAGLAHQAAEELRAAARRRREPGRALQRLALETSPTTALRPATASRSSAPLNAELAQRWLRHSETLRRAATQFRQDAGTINDKIWSERITRYAQSLEALSESVPTEDLRLMVNVQMPQRESVARASVPPEAYADAGFSGAPQNQLEITPHIEALSTRLLRHARELDDLATRIEDHPVIRFNENRERILAALCKFELARKLRAEDNPIATASETLVTSLLTDRVFPVLRELVAAFVRFEWYFKELALTLGQGDLGLGGLATERSDLDASMLLNSAERTVVGLSWFLALHLLQPANRRRVLVLDDASGSFDDANRAAFISTLRTFARLTRPDRLIVATHDKSTALLLAEEFTPVTGWPESVVRVRCHRRADDASAVCATGPTDDAADLQTESRDLGLHGVSAVVTN